MSKQKIINRVILLVAIIAIAFGGYFYYKLRTLNTDSNIAKKEIDSLVSKVSKLYLLPAGEEPTVATVSDPEVLKDQSFFTQSQKGDKVLIYTKVGRAILYRPSIDKIIETAPISNTPKSTSTVSPVTPTTTTIISPTPEIKKTTTTTTPKTPTKKP